MAHLAVIVGDFRLCHRICVIFKLIEHKFGEFGVFGDGYYVGFEESGYHFGEFNANHVWLRVNVVDLVIYHVWVVLVVDETDFGVFTETSTIDEIIICFKECGAFGFDYLAIHHEGGDDVVKDWITEFGVEIVANRENPLFGTIIVGVNHDFVDVAVFLFDAQVFKNSDDVWSEELWIKVEQLEKSGFFALVNYVMR
jgi:hypothetical protein